MSTCVRDVGGGYAACAKSHHDRFPKGVAALLTLGVCILGGCGSEEPPVTVTVWTWSEGARLEALDRLFEQFDRPQPSLVVRTEPWPSRGDERITAKTLRAALESTTAPSRVPALLEVPDFALPALIEHEVAQDVGDVFASRLGVRFDDFPPWLRSTTLMSSEGDVALPLYQEAPLLIWKSGTGLTDAWRARGFDALVETAEQMVPPGVRPLAAAADHRVFLAVLGTRGPDGHGAGLEPRGATEAYRYCIALLGGQAFPRGSPGELRAFDAVQRGEALAAWAWSGNLSRVPAAGFEVTRAPGRTRGTWLVVNSGAGWRERQVAFQLARWVTEPIQSADLAARLWTVPIRRSAAESARYRRAEGPRPWREAVAADGGAPVTLPASDRVMELMTGEIEDMLENGVSGVDVVERFQRGLAAADE